MASVADCLLQEYIVVCCHILLSPGVCEPWLSSGAGCRRALRGDRALFWVGVSAEQQQLLSPSNLVQHINYASSKLRPAFNHFYSQFVPILHLCCWEIFVFFLKPLHISVNFALFSLVFCWIFSCCLFFSPPSIISFYSPFHSCSSVLLRNRQYLLSGCMCHASLTYCHLTSASSVCCHALLSLQTSIILLLPICPLDMLFLAEYSMCREQTLLGTTLSITCLIFCGASEHLFDVPEGREEVLHTGLLSAFHHCYLSYY